MDKKPAKPKATDKKPAKLKDVLGMSSLDYESMLSTAVDCYSASKFSQAEAILIGLVTLNDEDVRPLKVLASCLLLEGRHIEAERVYELAHKLDPKDPYTLVALGEMKLKTLKLSEAVPLFEKLFAMDPKGEHPACNRGRQLVKDHYQMLMQR